MDFPPELPATLDDGVVSLTAYHPSDAAALFAALDHQECWEHIPRTVPASGEELDEQIRAKLDGHRRTLTVRRHGAVVGTTSVIDIGDPDGVEIGATQLTPGVWGTGVNRRAKMLLTSALFDAGCAWVQLRTDERNGRSAAAIRGLGAEELGTRPDTLVRRDGRTRSSIFFRLHPRP